MWDGGTVPPHPLSESSLCGLGVLCIIGGGRACHGLVFLLDLWEAFDFAALWDPFGF